MGLPYQNLIGKHGLIIMKRIILILSCILLFSCKAEKTTLSPFVSVYKSDRIGNILPSYIFLKTQPQTFEIYSPTIYGSFFGQWEISNDTLFLFPEYECFYRDSESRISKITPQDTSMPTIPQRYLIKDDSLIDITDYSAILPEPFNNQSHQMVYKRVSK